MAWFLHCCVLSTFWVITSWHFFFYSNLIYLFVLAVLGLCRCVAFFCSCSVQASLFGDFSCAQALGRAGFSNSGVWAGLVVLRYEGSSRIGDGTHVARGYFTAEPLGKPTSWHLWVCFGAMEVLVLTVTFTAGSFFRRRNPGFLNFAEFCVLLNMCREQRRSAVLCDLPLGS